MCIPAGHTCPTGQSWQRPLTSTNCDGGHDHGLPQETASTSRHAPPQNEKLKTMVPGGHNAAVMAPARAFMVLVAATDATGAFHTVATDNGEH